ncbi:MAG: hypothetical protein M1605_06340 [Candidatus Thermoplasmatota archaeon]|nr:hypothetical protein [Candidatus Thermoplasmatota archaeon]
MPLDELSKRIIRKFQWPVSGGSHYTNKPSVYKMAKEFHVHPEVIKNRINNLLESGLVRGVKFYADSRFMPWNRYFILTRAGNSLAKEISGHFSEFPTLERVIFGTLKLPNHAGSNGDLNVEREFSGISLIASDESEMKKQLHDLEKTLGHPLDLVEIMNDSPQKERLISPSEQLVLNAVMYQNPLSMSINKIAQELRVPARTVRRKITKMLDAGVIYEEVSFDTNVVEGVLLPSIIISGDYKKWLPAINESEFLRDKLLLYKNWGRFSFFIFYAETFSIVDKLIGATREIDPASMLTYRNGSYNNPHCRYPPPKIGFA